MTNEEIKIDALQKHPDCKYAEVVPGMNAIFQITRVVLLWRNEECWAAGDPPRYEEQGYSRDWNRREAAK